MKRIFTSMLPISMVLASFGAAALNQTTADWDTLALTARRDARLGAPTMAGSSMSWISLPQM